MTPEREAELRLFFADHCPAGLEALDAMNDARFKAGVLRRAAREVLELPPDFARSVTLRRAVDNTPRAWEVS